MAKGNEFKSGDIVKLKSGGPEMTLRHWSALQAGFECQWFAGKKLEKGYFNAESLELVKPEKS
ncbi:YodC family protein [Pseudomonas sp. FP603]|nr:DUF2158 domain-containing protein [Pseudomonas sp. FP603]WLI11228.1 DUF2158 domain-containing protein [Pseudomonas sp. FP603]